MSKIQPSQAQFIQLAKKFNTIPVWMDVLGDMETPVSAYLKLCGEHKGFLLESVEGGEHQARYSFIGIKPIARIVSQKNSTELIHQTGRIEKFAYSNPVDALKKIMSRFVYAQSPKLPSFCGGAVGYMSYECSQIFEPKVPKSKGKGNYPLMEYLIVTQMIVFDHLKRQLKILSNVHIPKGASLDKKKSLYAKAVDDIKEIQRQLQCTTPDSILNQNGKLKAGNKVKSNMSKKDFIAGVKAIKREIHRGEAIQVVLSRKFTKTTHVSPINLYRSLRSVNPSPYTFFLNCGDHQLIGSSPEVHVKSINGKVELRPIAGTRPRGKNALEDKKFEKSLLADPKEVAEHVMLVDLGRNDLGRVCKVGSVKVSEFMNIEKYSHVMHIVSHVQGDLEPKKDVYDIIKATFPAGTVSGAPKVRAMQIIAKHEKAHRGPYAGLVGYLSFSGNFDSCITIRTILINDGCIEIQAGAGIVSDSNPESEWQESANKAMGLLKAIDVAERGLL
ncbi:MAG: anthranilate synthase component 1 [Candidatus Omnitrophota bacterium]|jgi:anthranilate synthase component 1